MYQQKTIQAFDENNNLIPIFIIPFLFTLQLVGENRFYSSLHKNYGNNIGFENLYLINYLLSILLYNHSKPSKIPLLYKALHS